MKVFAAFAAAAFLGFLVTGTGSAGAQNQNYQRHGECKSAVRSVTATASNVGAQSDGGSIAIRSSISLQNQQSGQVVYCTFDGQTTATTSLGVALPYQSLFSDNLTGEVLPSCVCDITDGGSCRLHVLECK